MQLLRLHAGAVLLKISRVWIFFLFPKNKFYVSVCVCVCVQFTLLVQTSYANGKCAAASP